MKGQQQVPPGIVAFKSDHRDGLFLFKKQSASYEDYVNEQFERGRTIHTISVDGKEWSLQQEMLNGSKITAFMWRNNDWVCELDNRQDPRYYVSALTPKIPPPPDTDRSQPGKEEDFPMNRLKNIEERMEKLTGQSPLPVGKEEAFNRTQWVPVKEHNKLLEKNIQLLNELAALKLQTKEPSEEEIKTAINEHFKHDGIFSNGSDYECADSLEDMRKGAKWAFQWLSSYKLKQTK